MRPEDALQIAVVKLLRLSGLTFTATANGAFLQGNAQQRAIRGARMKAHGVSNGVPDLLIFQPFVVLQDVPMRKARCFTLEDLMAGKTSVKESRVVCGLAIELKAGKNKPTPDQVKWMEDLRACGWRAEVCNGMDEVLALLRECYPGKVGYLERF